MSCDHIIGVSDITEAYGYTLYLESEPKIAGSVPDHYFDYCPKCGTKLKEEPNAE